jgi:iron complex transport system ATP-binding protein
VEAVFDLRCQIVPDPVSHTPLVIPIGRHHHERPRAAESRERRGAA